MTRFAHVSPQHLSIVAGCDFTHHHMHDYMMRKSFDMKPVSHFDEPFAGHAYGFRELTLADMLRDPIVQDLMRSDGVSRSDLRRILNSRHPRNLALAA
jgi:hypothetical protein